MIGLRPTSPALLGVLLATALLLAGCGADSESATIVERVPRKDLPKPPPEETVQRSHCPVDVPGCAVTEGRIAYVEAVDPDSDGDAHFVVVDGQSITLPGLTAIDLEKGLRPRPLPGVGELVSAAGPVQTGSYGQEQIHALEFHVAKPAR